MEIKCPVCDTAYNIPEDKLSSPVSKATCNKCGAHLLINKETGKTETMVPAGRSKEESGGAPAASSDGIPSIMSQTKKEERVRDNLAIGVFVVGLILLVVTGYFAIKNIHRVSIPRPIRFFSQWVVDTYIKEKKHVDRPRKDIRPQTPQARESREHLFSGHKLFRKKKYDEALEEYSKALQIDPSNFDAYYWRGRVFARKGEKRKAIDDYKNAIELNPSHALSYDSIGWLYSQMNKWDESIKYLNKSIALRPRNGWAYYNRGRCFYKKGDLKMALKDAKKACDLGYKDGCKIYRNLKK